MSVLIEVYLALVECLPSFLVYTMLQEKPMRVWQKLLIYIYGLFVYMVFGENLGQKGIPIIMLGTLLLLILFQKNILKTCAYAWTGYLAVVVWNNLLLVFLDRMGISFQEIADTYTVSFYTFFALTTFLLLCFLRWVLEKKIRIYSLQIPGRVQLLFWTELAACVLIYAYNIISGETIGYEPLVLQRNAVLFLLFFGVTALIFIFMLRILEEEQENRFKIQEYDNLKAYTGEMERMYQEMRLFRHDYQNILATMTGYMQEKDLEGLEAYFQTTILSAGQALSKGDKLFRHLSNVKLPELKGLLYAKLTKALSVGISVDLEVPHEIAEVSMELLDLCKILGIFLDNAREAALETEEKRISVGIWKQESGVQLLICNSCREEAMNLQKIWEKDVSSKGSGRGLGLYEVQEMLAGMEQVFLQCRCEDGKFLQVLNIMECREERS